MTILQLRSDTCKISKYSLHYIDPSSADLYGLSELSPARLELRNGGGWVIYILNNLIDEKKLNAEAHELAHILVMHNKESYIAVKALSQCKEEEDIDLLEANINNAISHKIIVPLLSKEYGINSDLHINALKFSIPNQSDLIQNVFKGQKVYLHGIGVKLHDIAWSCPDEIDKVEEIVNLNPEVLKAYDAATNYLSDIITQDINEQKCRVIELMNALGYIQDENYILYLAKKYEF